MQVLCVKVAAPEVPLVGQCSIAAVLVLQRDALSAWKVSSKGPSKAEQKPAVAAARAAPDRAL